MSLRARKQLISKQKKSEKEGKGSVWMTLAKEKERSEQMKKGDIRSSQVTKRWLAKSLRTTFLNSILAKRSMRS